jgi:hypothetical protein
MARRLLEYDPYQRKSVYHHYDYATDITRIETVYDVEPILNMNKERAKDDEYQKKGIKKGWWHVGTIPNGVIAKWMEEGINFYDKNDWPAVKRKLNSAEYSYLRTGRGKL